MAIKTSISLFVQCEMHIGVIGKKQWYKEIQNNTWLIKPSYIYEYLIFESGKYSKFGVLTHTPFKAFASELLAKQ